MGVKGLFEAIKAHAPGAIQAVKPDEFRGKVLGVDASLALYQFIIAIHNQGDLLSESGASTSHIQAILGKTLSYLKQGIRPVFVFDGEAPELKNATLRERTNGRLAAQQKLEASGMKEEGDADDSETKKLKKRSVRLTRQQVAECQSLLSLMGIPYVLAPQEADAQLAYMNKAGLIDGVISEDMDMLPFGCGVLLRSWGKKEAHKVVLTKALMGLAMTMEQFVDYCILLGTDYNDTLPGIGKVRALASIKEHGSIAALLDRTPALAKKVPANFPFAEIERYFRDPVVRAVTPEDLRRQPVQAEALKALLVQQYTYSSRNSERIVAALRNPDSS